MLGVPGWLFWMTAGGMAVGVAVLLMLTVRRSTGAVSPQAFDLRVYRDQLAEVDRDLQRGNIGFDDAAKLRTEISRRVLDADRAMLAVPDTDRTAAQGWATPALIAAIIAAAVAGYWHLGAPGYPDMPLAARKAMADTLRATRPGQGVAQADTPARTDLPPVDPAFAQMMEELRAATATRPDDLTGQDLLMRNEASLGNFAAAHAAQARIIALKADQATAQDYTLQAELMIFAAGGYVSPEAETALTEALKRDPEQMAARYYSGLMLAQTGRPDLAFRLWRPLVNGPQDAPWMAPLRSQIENLALAAGESFTLPPVGAGPTDDDIAAAATMTPQERQDMIRAMVAQLSERLATEGGPASDWARLISSYAVLGDTDQARAIWAEAQTRFAARPQELAVVRAAAQAAGVTE